MLWSYSPSTNNHNKVQFLLPFHDEPEIASPNFAFAQDEHITVEAQQVLQKLFYEFLTQLGYAVTNNETIGESVQGFTMDNVDPLTIEEILGMLHSFALCATLRDHSLRPLLMLNTLIANVYEITEQQAKNERQPVDSLIR